jgi:hypothetical protein
MTFKTKRIPIATEAMGRIYIEQIRGLYGNDVANKVRLINEISFNVPVYDFGTVEDKIAFYTPEWNNWYLEFPEEITVNT